MVAVARNNSSASLSLFLDINNLEVVENAEDWKERYQTERRKIGTLR